MAVLREEIAKRIKGSHSQTEDWWHLCLDTETGEYFVEHSWDHVALNSLDQNVGADQHDADTWKGPGSENIKSARERLAAKQAH